MHSSHGLDSSALDIELAARAASREVRERQDVNDASIAKALADLNEVVNKILDRQRALEALDAGKAKALADLDAALNKILEKQRTLEDRQKNLEQAKCKSVVGAHGVDEMTAQRIDLFTEMTAAAEALVHDNTTPCKEDLQLEFRQIQKARRPELTTVEWLDLFDAWHEQYRALIEAKRARALEHFLSFIDQAARTNPPAPPFRCVCGAEGDPLIRSSSASTSHTSVSQDSTG